MINKKRLINLFIELVAINGKSGDETKIAEKVMDSLRKLGLKPYKDNADESFFGNCGNVHCLIPGSSEKFPILFFGAHLDTIEPTEGINTTIKDGIIQTDKSTILGADNRAGVAVILEIITTLIENSTPHPPIKLIFTVAEEIGMYGSKYLSIDSINADFGFVFDSSARPGKVITTAPFSREMGIKIIGKAAHAAVQPEKGINALTIASNALSKIEVGRLKNNGTLNFGTIEGGKAINTVPEIVEIKTDIRAFHKKHLESIVSNIKETFLSEAEKGKGKVEFDLIEKYDSFSLLESDEVVQLAFGGIENRGLTPEGIIYSGGSDANIYNQKGVPTVNLGMGFQMVHSVNEYIAENDLVTIAEIGFNIIDVAYQKNIKKIKVNYG
ncbi:MAG: M20/M25/M40 family metallo-hydrolase [Melioribacteraceae bacterium]|nr:M20/M25/M40 family metallo-hydrolase [Melioribacteraceae bacterium]